MKRWGDRHLSVVAMQVIGLACLIVAAWMVRDGWYALGLFGLALLAVAEVIHRQDP